MCLSFLTPDIFYILNPTYYLLWTIGSHRPLPNPPVPPLAKSPKFYRALYKCSLATQIVKVKTYILSASDPVATCSYRMISYHFQIFPACSTHPPFSPRIHGLPHDPAQRQRHGAALGAALVRQRQAAQQPVPRQRGEADARHRQGALQGAGAGALRFASVMGVYGPSVWL